MVVIFQDLDRKEQGMDFVGESRAMCLLFVWLRSDPLLVLS